MSDRTIKIKDLFVLQAAKSKGIDNYDLGDVPFVTSTESNNGVVGYVEPEEEDLVFKGPAIAISGLGHATVHFEKFLPKGNGGDSLTILMSREQALIEEILSLSDQYFNTALALLLFIIWIRLYKIRIFTTESIKNIASKLIECEEQYMNLPMYDLKGKDLVCFAAAFNTLHKWRFSYGRKCKISRIKYLEFPFPLPKTSKVLNYESGLLTSINSLVVDKLQEDILSENSQVD